MNALVYHHNHREEKEYSSERSMRDDELEDIDSTGLFLNTEEISESAATARLNYKESQTDINMSEKKPANSFFISGNNCDKSDILEEQLNLHPATNEMMKRVSSCYFSVPSNDEEDNNDVGNDGEEDARAVAVDKDNEKVVALVDVLYHDMMMHIFSYLDFKSLACFSETALCPNFECFYYLQLQLQQHLYSGSKLSRDTAQRIFQTYLNSNSTLKESTMPLSHSIQYTLQRLFFAADNIKSIGMDPTIHKKATALLMMIGAAAAAASTTSNPPSSYQVEAAAKLGLAAAGCGAVKAVVAKQQKHQEQEENNDQDHHNHDAVGITARLYNAFTSVYGHHLSNINNDTSTSVDTSPRSHRGQRVRQTTQENLQSYLHNSSINDDDPSFVQYAMNHPITPNPYDHPEPLLFYQHTKTDTDIASQYGESKINCFDHHTSSSHSSLTQSSISKSKNIDNSSEKSWKRKKPSGCVGAYLRAQQSAKEQWILQIKSQRLAKYQQMTSDEQLRVSTEFIDACTSDDTLSRVKELTQVVDVDAFHVGSDGTEACALHTAAFNGATQVLDFLCTGASDSNNIGGLCDVNLRDDNGWTALHFAAGTNAVDVVQLLAKHGAKLSLEADNGYTPYHWAQRLNSHDVVRALENSGAGNRFLIHNNHIHPQQYHENHHHGRFFGSFVATRMLSFLSDNLNRNNHNNNQNDHNPLQNNNNRNELPHPNNVI